MLRHACRLQACRLGIRAPLGALGARAPLLSGSLSLRHCQSDAAATPPSEAPSLVEKLKELESGPWWQSGFLRLVGTFSNSQWQKAAGNDLRRQCVAQAAEPIFFQPSAAAVDDSRWFTRFQLKGLHCRPAV